MVEINSNVDGASSHEVVPSVILVAVVHTWSYFFSAPARPADADSQPMDTDEQQATATSPRKIILTGPKQKTLHKEELTMSQEEKLTKARITHRAAYTNKRKSTKESPEKSSGSTKHGKPEVGVFYHS